MSGWGSSWSNNPTDSSSYSNKPLDPGAGGNYIIDGHHQTNNLGQTDIEESTQQQQQQQHYNSSAMMNMRSKTATSPPSMGVSQNKPVTASKDFVRKLYAMLEEPKYQSVVRWAAGGESFVVIDPSEFTKLVLPRHFKHSNFASFVRQLNKYDFHKVRSGPQEQNQYGENSWEFKHPDFQLNRQDQLDNIKRKAPSKRVTGLAVQSNMNSAAGTASVSTDSEDLSTLTAEVAHLRESHEQLIYAMDHLRQEHQYALRTLEYLRENALTKEGYLRETLNLLAMSNIGQAQQFQNLLESMTDYERKMIPTTGGPTAPILQPLSSTTLQSLHPSVIHTMDQNTATTTTRARGNVRDSFRILLGEEDGLVARLCSKFITQYGNCDLDLVSDGLEVVRYAQAANNYDLVLLDSILPSLDGVSVAELVHRSNPNVPIFLMAPKLEQDVVNNYIQRGISEILIKPFSKTLLHQKLDIYLKGYDDQDSKRQRMV